MRRAPVALLHVLLVAALAWGAGVALSAPVAAAGDAPSAPAPAAPAQASDPGRPLSVPGPFGPGHDTTRPEPVEPKPTGKGIEAATLVVAGPAEVEELRGSKDVDASTLYGVVLDVRIAAASTSRSLEVATVTLQEGGDAPPQGVFALCLPSAGPPLSMIRTVGVGLADWNVAVGERAFHCGGRNIRLASRFLDGGVTVTTSPTTAWQGPLVLLFRSPPAAEAVLKVADVTLKVPAPAKAETGGN